MKGRDFLSIGDVTPVDLRTLLDDAATVKKDPVGWSDRLSGKQIALIFEKPSTRTRVSFETAVETMGGHAIVLRGDELQLGRGETIEDTGKVLSRYVDGIVIRTFGQDRLERLAAAADVPVINALSDLEHPCQALADLQTIEETFPDLSGRIVAYIGDGNNVAHSLMLGAAALGLDIRVASPSGYEPDETIVERAREAAGRSDADVRVTGDPREAAAGAHVLYTDVWASMGQEDEASERKAAFAGYQIDRSLLDLASDDAIVMHCLPAHRGEEIAADVIDGPHSVVWDQAENRKHAQKALLARLLG
ncbi:MAG: ornithine carbamoyltransferase [Actinomycetota bacterium]